MPAFRALAHDLAEGLPKGITPYSLRHSFISASLYRSIRIAVVAEHCGTSVAMIERTYQHVVVSAQVTAFAAMDPVTTGQMLEAAE